MVQKHERLKILIIYLCFWSSETWFQSLPQGTHILISSTLPWRHQVLACRDTYLRNYMASHLSGLQFYGIKHVQQRHVYSQHPGHLLLCHLCWQLHSHHLESLHHTFLQMLPWSAQPAGTWEGLHPVSWRVPISSPPVLCSGQDQEPVLPYLDDSLANVPGYK